MTPVTSISKVIRVVPLQLIVLQPSQAGSIIDIGMYD